MNIDEFIQKPHPFLAGMSEAQLRLLAENATHCHFAAGDLIFREGDPANRFYLVQHGRVSLETHAGGRRVPVQTIGDGEVLGWSWLFPPNFWRFDAWAKEDTDAIFIYAAQLREQCETDKAFGYELMKRLAEIVVRRLQATRLQLVQKDKAEREALNVRS